MVYTLLGSNTLDASADEIAVDGLTAKNFLVVMFYGKQTGSGNFNARFRFNDSDSGYCSRECENFGTAYTQVNDNNTENLTGTKTSGGSMVIFHISNVEGEHHIGWSNGQAVGTGAGSIKSKQVSFVWNNTARIEKVKAYIDGTSDYASGSYLLVYGTD